MFDIVDTLGDLVDSADEAAVVFALTIGFVGAAIAVHTLVRAGGGDWRNVRARALEFGGAMLWIGPLVLVSLFVLRHSTSRHDEGVAVVSTSDPAREPSTRTTAPTRLSAESRPYWIDETRTDGPGGREYVTVHSRQFATLEEAEEDALARAVEVVREDVRLRNPRLGSQDTVPPALVDREGVVDRAFEPILRSTGNVEFTVYRAHYRVELSDALYERVAPVMGARVASRRLWRLGSVAGFLTIVFGTIAGYIRLDQLTGGRRRGRLRFAAASIVTATGLFAAMLVSGPDAAHGRGERPIPAEGSDGGAADSDSVPSPRGGLRL